MTNNSSRQLILEQIAAASKRRLAYVNSSSISDKIYKTILPDPITCFKNELETISGQFFLCENEDDLYKRLQNFLINKGIECLFCRDQSISSNLKLNNIAFCNREPEFVNMKAGITKCEFLIARTGSVLISSASESGRQMNVFPPIHIVIAKASQLVSYPEDALVAIQHKYNNLPSIISTITGPSRTADIEKTLVLGAHGPKEFIVFLSKV